MSSSHGGVAMLIIAVALVSGIPAQEAWHRYVPDDSAFVVSLPGDPITSVSYTETKFGLLPTRVVSVDRRDNNSFFVSWTEYRTRRPAASDSTVSKMVSALARAKDAITVEQGDPGAMDPRAKPAILRSSDGRTIRVRFFFAGNRIYQVMTETKSDAASEERSKRFLESFDMLRR